MKNVSILRARGLKPKKSFGQNFLEDQGVLRRIAARCQVKPEEATVVEIGAGLGALTASLVDAGAKVVAIERDRDLAPVLRARFERGGQVEVLEENALTMDFTALHARLGVFTLCGNLPYHLTSPLIFRALEHVHTWRRMVVMVQREVADRMAASEGTREFGVLSAMLGARLHVDKAFDVPPGAFHPPPKVWSSVVELRPRAIPTPGSELPSYRRIVKAVFAARRKTVRNGLKPLTKEPERWLEAAGVDPGLRPEVLPLAAFGRLAQVAWPEMQATLAAAAMEDDGDLDGGLEDGDAEE